MRYRALSPSGDFSFGAGAGNFLVDSPATVAQAIRTRLLLFRSEWFLDVNEGTPWMTEVLGRGTTALYDNAIQDRIRETPGVIALTAYNSVLDRAKRALTISATVTTRYGSSATVSLDLGPALVSG
jgi:hypothetical protein